MNDAPERLGPAETHSRTPALLGPGDPPPLEAVDGLEATRLLLLCDHAANAIPAVLGDLGVAPVDLQRHIAYDIGAAAVTRALAAILQAPALLSGYSRLVVDCNRALDDETLMPAESDGTDVPGNLAITPDERAARLDACFWPYHQAIAARLDRFAAMGIAPAIVAIHSFTPRMEGFDRPWHIGILWDDDPRLPVPLMAHLSRIDGLVVGDNEPYSARDPHGFTMPHHAARRGLAHVLIELRQDEIATDAGAARYAQLLADTLRPILADPALYRSQFFR